MTPYASRDGITLWHDDAIHRKASERSGIAVPEPPKIDGQLSLLGGDAA